jgi:arylsulfatase A-like enzyme
MKKISRRTFIKQAAVTTAASILPLSVGASDKKGNEMSNLLVIHCDELNFRKLGCYGDKIVDTPNIDFLAENGARCTGYYATSPVCTPSRGSFVTGRYPQHHQAWTNNLPLGEDEITFAEVLAKAGYITGYAGKWHLGGEDKPGWAPKGKFGFQDNRYMFNRGHWKRLEDTPEGPLSHDYKIMGDEESYTTDWLTTKTIEFIEEHKGKPFCHMLSLPDPHGPNTVRAPYDTMFKEEEISIPETFRAEDAISRGRKHKINDEAKLRKIMSQYYGMIKCIDDNLGRILDALRKHELLEDTMIVFTADHGDMCGEYGRLDKGVPYDGSAKIPFILYHPQRVAPGQVLPQAMGCVDSMPTILSLLGAAIPQAVQGRDASGLFTGESDAWDDVAFIRHARGQWIAVANSRYKLVKTHAGEWLFDLRDDPFEMKNIIDDQEHQPAAVVLRQKLAAYCEEFDDGVGK